MSDQALPTATDDQRSVHVRVGAHDLAGDLAVPAGAEGLVLFAHGSGSSRRSPRNRHVAAVLNDAGLGTLLFDLLTPDEELVDERTARLRFDIALLTSRLVQVTDWVRAQPELHGLRLGYFGASTGAAAALAAAAARPVVVAAVVARGGRPDLAGEALRHVAAPVLLLVGGEDREVIELNRQAMRELAAPSELEIIPGASHLFVEPGTLDLVAAKATAYFLTHLTGQHAGRVLVEVTP